MILCIRYTTWRVMSTTTLNRPALNYHDEEDETKHPKAIGGVMLGDIGHLSPPAKQPLPSTTEGPTDPPQQNPNDLGNTNDQDKHSPFHNIYWRPSQSCPRPPQVWGTPRIRTMGRTRATKKPLMTFLQLPFSQVTARRKAQVPTTHPTAMDHPQVRLGNTEERYEDQSLSFYMATHTSDWPTSVGTETSWRPTQTTSVGHVMTDHGVGAQPVTSVNDTDTHPENDA